MLFITLMAALFASYLVAQQDIPSPTSTRTANATQDWPIKSIFLPIDIPSNLAASVITAAPDRTAYAIGCLDHYSIPDTDNDCDFGTSFRLTEGISTLIYTMTYDDDASTSGNGATVHCKLEGGTRATAATCIGKSTIAGLGTAVTTSTLASTQISYAPVTITAGAAKLTSVPQRVGGTTGSEGIASVSSGGAEVVNVRWMGVLSLGLAVIGAL